MVLRSLFGFEARATGSWCGRRDLNPHGPCGPTDFLSTTAFAAPLDCSKVWGLDYPFAMPQISFGIRRCPSSLYTFPTGTLIAPAGLGSDRHVTGFPDFEQFYHRRFPGGHSSFRLSPMRLPIPPRPHGFKHTTKCRLTRSDF